MSKLRATNGLLAAVLTPVAALAVAAALGASGPMFGFALLATAGIAVLAMRRPADSQMQLELPSRADRTTALAQAVTRGAHAPTVLMSLAQRACEIVGVEVAAIATRDRAHPDKVIVVAGCGIRDDAFGQHRPAEGGLIGTVLESGRPRLASDDPVLRSLAGADHGEGIFACGAVPIVWKNEAQGVLATASTDPAHLFGESELAVLARLAELGAAAIEHAEIRQQLEQAVESSVEAMAHAIALRDQYTSRHSDDVVDLALAVGERLGLDSEAIVDLRFGARLHDLGKIAVPDAVLHKDGSLDEREWEIVRQHPTMGAEMLRHVSGLERVAEIVRAEHERWDGDGYPDGLSAEEIPLASRIVFACDAFNAMTTDRPYRQAMPIRSAAGELAKCAGSQFDPVVVDKLLEVLYERQALRGADAGSFAIAS